MSSQLAQLVSSRDLIWAWTSRTIRGRYQQSMLGWLWAVIQPAASVLIFTIVFTLIVPVDTGSTPYIVFSYAALVPWTFFASSLGDMTISLVSNMNLVTKIYFPREALPIATMMARLLDFGIASILLLVLLFIYHVPVFPLGWLYLPVILVIQLALVIGLGLLFAALNVFARDVDPLLRLFLQLWFYATPVIYPVSMVPSELQPYYFLNPMAGIIQSYRDVLLDQSLPGSYLAIAGLISGVILVIGYWFFKRVEFQFADIV
jgi:lipopolysaccharide transport system permease protein